MIGGPRIFPPGRRVLLAIALALASAACGGDGGREGGSGPGPPALGPSLPAQSALPVEVSTEVFVDSSRPTPEEGDAPARASRTLVTTIARPARPGPFPLILFSHGFGGSGEDYAPLLRAIASAGYVVAAPDYPLTSKNTPGGPQRGSPDMAQQPTDASFVIGEVGIPEGVPPAGPGGRSSCETRSSSCGDRSSFLLPHRERSCLAARPHLHQAVERRRYLER